jgi:hypothetical protein
MNIYNKIYGLSHMENAMTILSHVVLKAVYGMEIGELSKTILKTRLT